MNKNSQTNAITGLGDFTKGRLISVSDSCSEDPAKRKSHNEYSISKARLQAKQLFEMK